MSMMNLENKDEFRPYHSGMTDREPSMATIVLMSKGSSTEKKSDIQTGLYDSFQQSVSGKNGSRVIKAGNKPSATPIESMGISEYSTVPTLEIGDINNASYYGVFNNFSVTNVSEAREELVRIAMNFGGNWNAFFFGENPRVFTFQGLLLDSPEYPFYQEFISAYDKYLSGRKCVINKMKMVLSYDGRVITGYILKLVNDITADQYMMKQFSFTVLVESEAWFRTNPRPDGTWGLNYMDNSNRYGQGASAEVPAASPSATISSTTTTTVATQTTTTETVTGATAESPPEATATPNNYGNQTK